MDAPRIRSFLLLTFIPTWSIAGIGALAGIRAESGIPYVLLAATCMLMPAMAAIVQHRLIDKQPWPELGLSWRPVRWRFLWSTVLIGALIIPTTLLVIRVLGSFTGAALFGTVDLSSTGMIERIQELSVAAGRGELPLVAMDRLRSVPGPVVLIVGLIAAVVAAFTVNLPFMLGEELGWRGYLYARTAAWKARDRVLFTGVVWGTWHAPLILMGHNYPDHRLAGVGLMVIFCVLLALLFDRSRTRVNAVWGPCVLHGIINGSAGLFALFASSGHPLIASPVGLCGFIAIGLLGGMTFLVDGTYRRSWSKSAPPEA